MTTPDLRQSALRLTLAAAIATSLLVSGCSDSDPGTLEVAVSSGYPITGAKITLKGANGATLSLSDTANAGSVKFWRRDVNNVLGVGPYLVQSTGGKANGISVTEDYYSIASAAEGRTNVTPITHLIAVEATGSNDAAGLKTLFASGFNNVKAQTLTAAKLATAKANVSAVLALVNPQITLDTYDPLTVSFSFGDSVDNQLDYLKLALRTTNQKLDAVQALVVQKSGGATPTADDLSALKPVKRIVVFGDSLTDGGAYTIWAAHAASGADRFVGTTLLDRLAAASIWGGKFTTNPGQVWVEKLASLYGVEIKPALLMGGGQNTINLFALGCAICTNYAQGGARVRLQPGIGNAGTIANPANVPVSLPTGEVLFPGNELGARVSASAVLAGLAHADYTRANAFLGASTLPVTEQIDIHLSSVNGRFAQGDLVLVLAGANDVFTQAGAAGSGIITSAQAGEQVQTAAADLATQAVRLRQAGATQLLVIGLPDMGSTPAGVAGGKSAAAALTMLSTQVFNAVLSGGLKAANIAYLDPVEFFGSLMTNPSKHGLRTTIVSTNPATAVASTACGPNQIATAAAGDDPNSPSSLFCSVPNAPFGNLGTLRVSGADGSYVFADGVHPSTQAHKALAEYLSTVLPRLIADTMVAAN